MGSGFWKNKSVFLTGHTGFKGGWIAHWLTELGACVHGYALSPATEPSFFKETKLQERIFSSTFGDIRDLENVAKALKLATPDIVIHMAAQPLVRESYRLPVETFTANVMGTINVLEAARYVDTVKVVVVITTDKCYENKEWFWSYREDDHLGGHDPYSASKACAELTAAAYRKSFFAESGVHLASVRAGNVIGGGDWASDRLIPDFLRAVDRNETVIIRSPHAVRPWQHVLEPLSGYLMLTERLYEDGEAFAEAWNFGPNDDDAKPVNWIVEQLCKQVPGLKWRIENANEPHEANLLKLDSGKARAKLGWAPRWNLQMALNQTIDWYQACRDKEDMAAKTTAQIHEYCKV